jgi:S-adenosylmethionine/arginine decarboxylase-like enzyme
MFEWEDMLMIQICIYIECYGCGDKETNHLQMIKKTLMI